MRDRTDEKIEENREEIRPILDLIMKNLGIDENEAYFFAFGTVAVCSRYCNNDSNKLS